MFPVSSFLVLKAINSRKNNERQEVVFSFRFSEHLVIFFYQVVNQKIRVGFKGNAYNLVSFPMIG